MASLLGSLRTMLFGAAIGRSTSDSVTPVLEPVRQHAWTKNQVRVLDPSTAAEARAKGILDETTAEDDASRSGVGVDRFGVLLRLAQEWPGMGELHRLANRDLISPAVVVEALTRSGFPGDLIGTAEKPGPLVRLFQDILTPGELAAAVHRGLVPDEGLLLGEQPKGPFKVEAYPVQPIDAVKEAAGSGYDKERLQVLIGLQGLPMGPHEAAQALFRGIITHGDYIRAFNTSNMRNEWAKAILEQTRQIPTARDFMENALRGHHDFAWAAEQAARHGMSKEDAFLIYQNQGRPLNLHQITQGLAWGGKYEPGEGDDADPWMQAVLLGAVRPEYYNLQHSLKYNLPSALYFRTLQQQNVLKEDEAATWYKRLGWPPELAAKVAAAYAKPAGADTDPHVAKAQTQLWTATHASYLNREASATVARTKLQQAGVETTAIAQILGIWDHERELIRKGLSPANVKKAFAKGSRNNATGQPWTRDEAIAFLVGLGWSANEANDYLDIP